MSDHPVHFDIVHQIHNDRVVNLMHDLCMISSWWEPNPEGGAALQQEYQLGLRVNELLSKNPWLSVENEEGGEHKRENVFAKNPHTSDADIKLLIVGHLDTVPPSSGWTIKQGTIQDDRYYNLGASDTKGGIAAVIDAIDRVGPTDGVAYLFYVDEEYLFKGMHAFLERHPDLKPELVLSVCGAPAALQNGCRGCLEFDVTFKGVSGHASRAYEGRSALEAAMYIAEQLRTWAATVQGEYTTSLNVAAMRAGSLDGEIPKPEPGSVPDQTIPPTIHNGNKIPNVAWMRVDVRPGNPKTNLDTMEALISKYLTQWQDIRRARLREEIDRPNEDALEATVSIAHFERRINLQGYASPPGGDTPIREAMRHVHKGREATPATFGYIDVAMIAAKDPTISAVCMGPLQGNAHGPDEWIDIPSLLAYRDGMVDLLRRYQT